MSGKRLSMVWLAVMLGLTGLGYGQALPGGGGAAGAAVAGGVVMQGMSERPAAVADPMIQKIVGEISEERVTGIMRKLESFETRNTMSDATQAERGIGAARQWIFEQFKSYSPRLEVSFDTYTIPQGGRIWKDVELRNVVAVLPGKSVQSRGRWIMISGHYDSINLRTIGAQGGSPARTAEAPAPGVSDDASGTACAMECARVMSRYEFNATLVFVAFAGEEQGLLGAKAMAKRLHGEKQEIEAVLNNDIIGTDVSGNGVKDDKRVLVFSEDPDDSPSRELARYMHATALRYCPEMTAEMIFRYDRFGRGGDHTAFNLEGYPAVRFTTPCEDFANQHSPTDTLANAAPGYATKVIRINAAAAASLALAPRPPVTMQPAGQRAGRAGAGGATTAAGGAGGARRAGRAGAEWEAWGAWGCRGGRATMR